MVDRTGDCTQTAACLCTPVAESNGKGLLPCAHTYVGCCDTPGACNRVHQVPGVVVSLDPDSLSVPDRSDPLEKTAVLVSLGIFAFFVLAAVLVITILIW